MCSFTTRRREDTGITLFETVPELASQIDTHDVLSAIGPRTEETGIGIWPHAPAFGE